MPGRFNTTGKNTVRERWNTPVLKYLHDTYHIKYRYLGLPGVELIDIKLWKEMIEEVIAFQISSAGNDEKADIKALKKNLELSGIKGKAYYGSLEHVILMKEDLDGTPYKQNKLITLYNLDFCDEITSRIHDVTGNKCLRFDAIRQILIDQHQCFRNNGNAVFIMLLTTRNQTSTKIMREYLFENAVLDSKTYDFVQSAANNRPLPIGNTKLLSEYGWALRAFIYNTISSYFSTPHLSCLFFPMVKYIGMPIDDRTASPMIHWMLLCKFEDPQLPRPKVYPQNYLLTSTLTVSGSTISESRGPGESCGSSPDSVSILKKHEKYFFS